MKRIAAVLSIWLLLLCGCTQPATPIPAWSAKVRIGGTYQTHMIRKFEFEGHRYLFIDGYQQGGLEHDPNCPCFVK